MLSSRTLGIWHRTLPKSLGICSYILNNISISFSTLTLHAPVSDVCAKRSVDLVLIFAEAISAVQYAGTNISYHFHLLLYSHHASSAGTPDCRCRLPCTSGDRSDWSIFGIILLFQLS